jgi:Na+/melibiose symporter-like transporter
MYGVLARATTGDERTRYFAVIKGSNLLGIAFGPALNFFLRDFNFYIGDWHIDYRTSPGFFMAITWTLVTGLMHAFAYDLSDGEINRYEQVSGEICEQKLAKRRQLREAYGIESSGDENAATPSTYTARTNDVIEREKMTEKDAGKESNGSSTASFKNALVEIFSKFQILVPMYFLFFSGILYTSFQAITPLVTERTLNWSEIEVSILFTAWGVEIVIVIFSLWFVSRKISDHMVLLSSSIFGILASAFVFLLPFWPGRALLLAIFLQGISLGAVVVGRSLVSKHTDSRNQATVQAIVDLSQRSLGYKE